MNLTIYPNSKIGSIKSSLFLDFQNAILLPVFDTASIIADENIQNITLSLFVKETNSTGSIHVTINPFDLNTGYIQDGLSSYISPKIGGYVDFKLPRELFEKTIKSTNRLLIKMVDSDKKIEFIGPDIVGTSHDPKLVVVYIKPLKASNSNINFSPIEKMDFGNITIGNNSKVIIGNNNIITDSSKSLLKKILIEVFILLVGSVILYFLGKVFNINLL